MFGFFVIIAAMALTIFTLLSIEWVNGQMSIK